MNKKSLKYLIGLFLLILTFSLLILIIFSEERITGRVVSDVAQGGNITNLRIDFMDVYWKAYYGSLTGSLSDPISLNLFLGNSSVDVLNLGLYQCYNSEIYVTNGTQHLSSSTNLRIPSVAYINSLKAADLNYVDNFTGFSSLSSVDYDYFSFTHVFNQTVTHTFNVGDNILNSYYLRLNSQSGDYLMGLLNDSYGNVVYVFEIDHDKLAYDGRLVDFELTLPISFSGSYYFFQDPQDNCVTTTTKKVILPEVTGEITSKVEWCGNKECGLTENCTTCSLDCGECFVEEEILPWDGMLAEVMLRYAKDFIDKYKDCNDLNTILDDSRLAYSKGNYGESISFSRKVIDECNQILMGKAYGFTKTEMIRGIYYYWLLIVVIIVCLIVITLLLYYLIKKDLRVDILDPLPKV